MVKTNLLYQLLLVMCCISLMVVSAMPQRSSRRKDEESGESCEDGRCSRPGLRNGDSEETSFRKPGFLASGRPRRPSLINAGPLNQQKIDTSLGAGGFVDPADPSTGGAACPTCTGTTGAAGANRIAPLKKLTFGGLIKTPGSTDQVDPSGAACTNCAAGGTAGGPGTGGPGTGGPGTGGPTSTGAAAGSGNLADPLTGVACPTCTATGATGTRKTTGTTGTVGTAGTTGTTGTAGTTGTTGTAGTTGTTSIRKPSLGGAGGKINTVSANQTDPATGAACTTCKDAGTVGATGTAGTTGTTDATSTKKPGTIDTSRIRKPGSATGTPCTNCTAATTDVATGTTPTKKETPGSTTAPADPSAPCPTCTSTAGTANATATTGPTRIRKPSSTDSSSVAPCANCTTTTTTTTTTCTTCTSNGTASEAGTAPVESSSLTKKSAEIKLPSFKSDMKEITNTSLVETVDHIHFDYDDPNKWKEHNSLCKGPHQSPIDIQTRKTILSSYPNFTFVNYDRSYPENLENNGHTVQLSIDKLITDLPSISGGGLDGTYQFAQLHFHWGEGMFGSEHTIDSKQYVAEVHIVHWDTKYGNFVNATKHNDGLAVLGVLVELQARDNIAFRHLEQFEKLMDVGCAKTDQLSYSVPLADLLPDSTTSFYRYAGSLTDARCNEDVIWTVFDTPIAISERQLAKFRLLTDDHGRKLTRNVRPTQHSHRRTVIYNPSPQRVA